MVFRFIFFLLILFTFLSCKSEAAKVADEIAVKTTVFDSAVTHFQKKMLAVQLDSVFSETKFHGIVSIKKDGELLYEKAVGFENLKTEKKLDSNSVFAIASVSKQFTAVLILLLEERGKLSVDDPVATYLPEFAAPQFSKIKIRELLNHTSGISDHGPGLLSPPGAEFHYSNKGYRFLGQIAEKVSGKNFDQNLADVFKKAGMRNSFSADSFTGGRFASAHLGAGPGFSEVTNMPKRLAAKEISVPAGGVLSSVSDLHRWNFALYQNKILNQVSFEKFIQKSADREHPILGKMDYGLGIMMNARAPLAYFHTGYVKGSPSLLVYYPKSKISVVVLSNVANESLGKKAIFAAHKRIKEVTDLLELASVK